MLQTGFTNSFTSGEICEEAWDRVDIQPISKGCEVASNYVVNITGPLSKRRGFWLNGPVADPTKLARLIPFRRSVSDALMLEFGDSVCHVWQANGSPLMNAGVQVSFATPYSQAQLAGLRWKQVADVIYFRHATGLQPQALTRNSDTSWTFAAEDFPNGPWQAENADTTQTITVSGGVTVADLNPDTSALYIDVGGVVTLTASNPIFDAGMIGSYVRLRQNPGESVGIMGWSAGVPCNPGYFCVSLGNIYISTHRSSANNTITNPPVHTSGSASDGGNIWKYVGDGAGIVKITGFTSSTVVTGTITAAIPFGNVATSAWSLAAYSPSKGWPRMWPSLREERLVSGATAGNLDMVDLTESAGFYPTKEVYHPGLGTGSIIATDAIRRRLGDDGGEILWSHVATYLVAGTVSGEYLIAGSVLDEPLSPSAVTVKQLSAFGSADVYPARVHKGIIYVTRAGATLRELSIDNQQGASTDDLTVLARHIAERGIEQLAWILAPDETLWLRMADGGLACLVYHQEQQVRGYCTTTLPAGWICEDIQALPGPGGFETLWAIWSRQKAGATQRVIVMQSQVSDGLFMDLAQAYAGAGVSTIGGLTLFEGETMTVLANGAQLPDVTVDGGGNVATTAGTTSAQVGFRYDAFFRSLRLNVGGSLNARERVAGAIVSMKTTVASVGLSGGNPELVDTRLLSDIPNVTPKRTQKDVTLAGDFSRDPRIEITDSTAYDSVIYSIKPRIVVGG